MDRARLLIERLRRRPPPLPALAAAFLVCVLALRTGDAMADQAFDRPPNLLLIVADDLGYGDLGCYDQHSILTPNIDRLAAEGMRFTQVYAGGAVSASSRCSLMTGLHLGHSRIRGLPPNDLLKGDLTVAELLQGAGYATGLIGKWGLGGVGSQGHPNLKGFDEFFGYLTLRDAFDYYPEFLWRNGEKVPLADNLSGGRGEYSHDRLTAEALEFLARHRASPFFLYLAYTIPHADLTSQADPLPVPSLEPYADRDWPEPQKRYAAMVTRLDRDVGRLLDRLDELGLAKQTLVFFTSDHGPHRRGGFDPDFFASTGGLRGGKFTPYEGGIRVPMIARCPGKIPAGVVSDQVWAFWDFLPTAAEAAGVAAPETIDGLSMLPALLGRPLEGHEFLYWEFHERGFSQAVRMGRFKGVRHGPAARLELYDLQNDRGERHDVARERPQIVKEIEDYMAGARTDSEHWRPRPRRTR